MRLYLDYKIIISKKVQKFLESLDSTEYAKIALKINNLTTPAIKTLNIKKLQSFKNLYRLKVNDIRIIYSIDDKGKLLIVAAAGPRKDIYFLIKNIH